MIFSKKSDALEKAIKSVLYTGVIASLAMAPAVFSAEDEDAEDTPTVTVTGSRIVRGDLEGSSPVTSLDAEEITITGNVRIEDLVSGMPQAFAGQNSTVANGASGTATVDLRQLGTTRTLVLINGRRMAPGDVFSTAPDLNFIPSTMIKRVDVLTGGASSVYGTDAVAGVVNFIVDTEFEGIKFDFQRSFYQHDNDNALAQEINLAKGFDVPTGNVTDGFTTKASIAVGGLFDGGRGSASAYLTYRNIDSIIKGGRDYTNCTVNTGGSGPVCGGSSTTPRGRFIVPGVGDYVLTLASEGGDGSSFRPRTGEVFNYGPFNHIQRPDTKWTFGGFANYDINESTEAYVELMFMDDYTDAQIAPTGNFGRTTTINCDNPLLSAQQFDIICTQAGFTGSDIASLTILRRNIEGGPRTNQIRHTSFRMVSGVRGDINENWSYDVYGLFAKNLGSESYINDMNVDRIKDALDVITDPVTGLPVCRSGNAGCVPWNIFQEGGVTQEAVDYMTTIAVMNSSTATEVFEASFTGDLGFKLPSASENVQLALGAQYRSEELVATPDEVYSLGLRAGSGGSTPAINGSFSVKEFFFESLVPLVSGTDLIDDLSLELGYRSSDYSLSGKTNTYKALLSWTANDSIRVRGGVNRAIRSPNVLELFRPQGFGLGGNEDICANNEATGLPAATFEECARTGVTAAQYGNIIANPAQQYNTLGGGNPNLDPEIADTVTFGLVLTPASLPELSVSVDYYDIEIEKAIGSLTADDIIQTCATTGNQDLCSLIHRDALGTLWLTNDGYTETTNQNIGKLGNRGVDINALYSWDMGENGSLKLSVIGTYLLESSFSNPLTDYDCVGFFGPASCGQPNAEWRHRARLTWETNFDTNISMVWRYIGGTDIEDSSSNPNLAKPGNMARWEINGIDKLEPESFFDLVASYELNEDTSITFGINNILDTEPPMAPSVSSTGFSGTYDPLGRYIFLGLKANY